MLSDWQYSLNSLDVKAVPLSDIILLGLPNVYDWLRNRSIASTAVVDLVAYSQVNFENASTTTKM